MTIKKSQSEKLISSQKRSIEKLEAENQRLKAALKASKKEVRDTTRKADNDKKKVKTIRLTKEQKKRLAVLLEDIDLTNL